MTRPKKDQPIFPDGHRFSIDMNAMANAEMEGNPQVQPSPGSDYVAKIVPRKFQSLSNVDVSKISGALSNEFKITFQNRLKLAHLAPSFH